MLLIALLYVPAVQRVFATFVAERLEKAWQTEVRIGKVNIGFLNRAILDDVNISDRDGKELLHAARLSAKIELSPLLHGRVSISDIQLYGFHINIYQKERDDAHNFQFLVDAFAKDDGGASNPNLRINSILIRRGSISYHKLFKPFTPGRFDPAHIELNKISATVSLKNYTKDSLNLNVKKLSFEEQSGFTLKQLGFKFTANRMHAQLSDFRIELPHSTMKMETVEATYIYKEDSTRLGDRFTNLSFKGSIDESHFACQDFAAFYPPLGRMAQHHPLCIETAFNGDQNHISVDSLSVHTPDKDVLLSIPISINMLRNEDMRILTAHVQDCHISSKGMEHIRGLLPDKQDKLKSYLHAIGTLRATGKVSYSKHLAEADLHIQTAPGHISASGRLDGREKFDAHVLTTGFDLGRLTGNPDLAGAVKVDIKGKGTLHDKSDPDISMEGIIEDFAYKQYTYRHIALDMDYRKGGFEGQVSTDDPNAAITAEGAVNLKTRTPYIKIKGHMRHFNPHALALTSKYAGADFRADIDADFEGIDIENMNGYISVKDFAMSTAEDTCHVGDIRFESGEEQDKRSLTLRSDFINAEMSGRFTFKTLIANGQKMLNRYIPTFIKVPRTTKDSHDELSFFADIGHTEPLEKILGIPLQVHETGNIGGYFNSETGELDFIASFPSLTYNGQKLTDISVTAGHTQDSIIGMVDFKKQIGKSPVDFSLLARAAHDNIHTELNWSNHAATLYRGSISSDTRFSLDEKAVLQTEIQFNPTQIIVNDSVWDVHRSYVHIAPKHIRIDEFTIDQGARHLILDGDVSGNETDTLTADLRDINLEYVFNIINFHAVDFCGQATGKAYATNLMKSPLIDARLNVTGFTFNRALLGDMNLHGGWGKENNAIFLDAHIADPAHHSTTHVEGNIRIGAPPRGGLDLNIRTENIDLYFLNRYTDGIFTNLNGRASGWARVFGPFKGINLEGDMFLNHASTKVNAINVDFHIENDSVILRPDHIYFRNVKVYDKYGHPGRNDHYAVVNGVLQHSTLSNMRYRFDIDAFNVLGYDEREFGDNVFCGTAFVTGKMGLHGKPGELNVDIDARPEANTVFTYNQSSPTTLTNNQFMTYIDHTKDEEKEEDRSTPVKAESPSSDMRINFNLDLTPAATMKILMDPKAGDYIALNGHGNIRATYYNKGSFMMYGTYTVDHGIYKLSLQDVIRKDFIFRQGGTLVFGGPPFMADLNLQAVYTVPSVSLNDLSAGSTFSQNNVRVNCLMNLTGKAQAPRIGFDFDLPNVNEDEKQMVRSLISTEEEKNMQVIYLLGIGRFYTYDYNNVEQSQSSVAMKSLLSSTLSSQLNQMFSNILGNNSNWNIGTNLSTGEQGWSDMDVEGLLSGRLLNNRLLINGNFGYRDKNTTSNGNFIGDFDLQWLLTRSGNISLKAYSKTNDRYFTKSSLTTQGIGVALKRDFMRWKDLMRSFVPKKRRKAKAQRQEVKTEAVKAEK